MLSSPDPTKESKLTKQVSILNKFTPKDFIEGQPELRVRFTEVVRKYNKESMKSTCQVMKGCKSWKAKQISDSVFKLINEILTNMQGDPEFHTMFQPGETEESPQPKQKLNSLDGP